MIPHYHVHTRYCVQHCPKTASHVLDASATCAACSSKLPKTHALSLFMYMQCRVDECMRTIRSSLPGRNSAPVSRCTRIPNTMIPTSFGARASLSLVICEMVNGEWEIGEEEVGIMGKLPCPTSLKPPGLTRLSCKMMSLPENQPPPKAQVPLTPSSMVTPLPKILLFFRHRTSQR